MNSKMIVITVFFINIFMVCQSKKYDNFSLYNIMPTETAHLQFLLNLNYQKYIGLNFWKKPHKLYESVQFVVNPVNKEIFQERARNFKLSTELLIPNIQWAFDHQKIQKYNRQFINNFTWDSYHTLQDINYWLSDVADKFPDLVEIISIGKSAEGRDIFAVIVKQKFPKYKVIVEGGMHGNEWISVECVTYLLDQLTRIHDKSNWKLVSLLSKYEWHLIPVVNPDGYEFSQKQDRLWRKNRKPHGTAIGVDLDQNFDYNFGKYGATLDENDDFYSGPHVFSEPESVALAKYIAKINQDLKFYFSLHGYGQKIVIPYSDKKSRSDNYAETENFGRQAISKMYHKYGVKYSIGTTHSIMGAQISGNCACYVKKSQNVRFVYTFLLRDNGTFGHALPPEQIHPTSDEVFTGITELMNAKPTRLKLQLYNDSQQTNGALFLIFFCTVFVLL